MQVEKNELVLEICYFLQKLQITLKYNDIFFYQRNHVFPEF